MTTLFLTLLFIAGIAIILGGLLFIVYIVDSIVRKHDLPTSRHATDALIKVIQELKPDAKVFYDLGCAHGSLSIRVKKYLPSLEVFGVDNDAVRIFFARLLTKLSGREVSFKKQDIFSVDMSNADVVFTYLWYDLMPPLEKKLLSELRPGSLVITNTSHFQDWKPVREVITCPGESMTPDFETLFVYVKE